MSALLNTAKSLTPKPPTSLGQHIFAQLTHATLLSSPPQPHKKSLIKVLIQAKTPFGALKKDKKKSGTAVSTL